MEKVGLITISKKTNPNPHPCIDVSYHVKYTYPKDKNTWNGLFKTHLTSEKEIDICEYYRHPFLMLRNSKCVYHTIKDVRNGLIVYPRINLRNRLKCASQWSTLMEHVRNKDIYQRSDLDNGNNDYEDNDYKNQLRKKYPLLKTYGVDVTDPKGRR